MRKDPNEHVLEYLTYYCDPRNDFDFAVMLRGAWGGITRPTKRTIERGPGSLRAMYHSQRASAGWPQHHHRVVGALFRRKVAKQGHDTPPQLGVFDSRERLRECQPIRRRQE